MSTLAKEVGPELGPFLRWLIERDDLDVRELLDVLDDARAWEPEWCEWHDDERRACAPTRAECEGEERATR